MKILFLLPTLSVGGLERVQVTIANALAARGHDVTVMTYMEGAALAGELDPRVRFVYRKRRPFSLMRKIPYIRHKFYDDGMWETRASAKALHRYYVGKEYYDVEVAFFRGMGIKTISGCPKSRKTIRIAWVHTDFRLAGGYRNNFSSLEAVRAAYASFHSVVCVSEEAKRGFVEMIGETGNLSVIHNLLPVENIRRLGALPLAQATRRGSFHIVLVARLLDSAKGHCRLLNVVRQLQDEGFDFSLTFVGGGPDEKKIREMISLLGLSDRVTMTGSQNNPYPYIKEADLLICASYFEGYNLTVAEALILGVPVISTECTGPSEILDHGKYGMIVENSQQGIYRGLKELLSNPEKMEWLRQKAAERLGFFDEEAILQKIESLFGGAKE